MDAHDDEADIKLQKESADLIDDLDRALPKFLRKPDGHGGYRLRSRIRVIEKHRIDSAVRTLARLEPSYVRPPLTSYAFSCGRSWAPSKNFPNYLTLISPSLFPCSLRRTLSLSAAGPTAAVSPQRGPSSLSHCPERWQDSCTPCARSAVRKSWSGSLGPRPSIWSLSCLLWKTRSKLLARVRMRTRMPLRSSGLGRSDMSRSSGSPTSFSPLSTLPPSRP